MERDEFDGAKALEIRVGVRQLLVAVLPRIAMPREVFAASHDGVVVQAPDDRSAQAGHLLRLR